MKRLFLAVPLALLWVVTIAVPEATAFEQWSITRDAGYCADCHGRFTTGQYISRKGGAGAAWGTSLHDGHRFGMLNSDCNTCHQPPSGTPRFPVFLGSSAGGIGFDGIACVGCHGRDEGGGFATGAGLREHHEQKGVASCRGSGCHSTSEVVVAGENVLPPYYVLVDNIPTPPDGIDDNHPNKPIDPCFADPAGTDPGRENRFGPTGLDNDGDLLEEGADSDCAANTPPVADANGPYSGTVGSAVLFDGSGSSDADGTIVAYEWDFGDGSPAGTGVGPSHTYATDGVFTVTLTVTDDAAATDSDSTTATITIGNLPPTADPNGPYSGTVGVPVAFDGTGSSDPDGTIVSYEWDFGDGSPVGSGVSPNHTYASDGTFSVTLTVTDDGSLTDAASTTATIGPVPNLPPVADPDGPYTGTAGVAVLFDGSGSADPDGTVVDYVWDFGDGSPVGSGVSPSHTYASDGTYTVTLTVTDDDGATDTASTNAIIGPVVNEPPVADPNGPYFGEVGTPVAFDGTGSSDPDGTIDSYAWDFGDGGVGSGPTPSYTYGSDGTFTVTLAVTDDGGLTDTASTSATITLPAPIPPVADPNGPYVGTVGVPVQFDGSGSSDADGAIVAYEWDFGDGSPVGSGVSPTHTYATAGLYSVTLTVTDDDGLSDTGGTTANISAVGPMEVDLDVPGAINPGNNGVTPVKFWADMMDLGIAAVACGPGMAEPERLNTGDFNDDGFEDVVGLFRTGELGIVCGDEVLTCQGTLADGTAFTATSDVFKTVGRDCKPPKPVAKRGR